MINKLSISFILFPLLTFGEESDPCMVLHPLSRCVGELCSSLIWLDALKYTFDQSGMVTGTNIYCETAQIIKNKDYPEDVEPVFIPFRTTIAQNLLSERIELLQVIEWGLGKFPLITQTEFQQTILPAMRAFSDLIETKPQDVDELEFTVSNEQLGRSSEFKTIVDEIERWMPMIASVSHAEQYHTTLEIFSNFVSLASEIGGRFDEIMGIVSTFPTLYRNAVAVREKPILPLGSEHMERVESILGHINRIVAAAKETFHVFASGDSLYPMDVVPFHVSFDIFEEGVKLISSSKPFLKVFTDLKNGFINSVCPNIVAVAAFLTVPARGASRWERISHTVATMAQICLPHSTAEDRITVSHLFKGSKRFEPLNTFKLKSFVIKRDHWMEMSHKFLRNPNVDFSFDWAVIMENAEDVGYIGPRKQWLGDLVGIYFDPESLESVWQYTDETKRLITLIDDDSLSFKTFLNLRATGKLMGFALRYEIPIAAPFAPSFIKMLRLLHEPSPLDLDSLLDNEEPAFLKGLEWMKRIDWKNPPATVEWMSFDDLIPNGEDVKLSKDNIEYFMRLKKEIKLFHSKRESLSHLVSGVTEVVGAGVFGMLSEPELRERLCKQWNGFPPSLLFNGIDFRNFNEENELHAKLRKWLEEIIINWTDNDRYAFNRFVTGIREPPLTAVREKWIKLFFEPALPTDKLPVTHTCHNEIQLPLYNSRDTLKKKLYIAIHESGTVEGYQGYQVV